MPASQRGEFVLQLSNRCSPVAVTPGGVQKRREQNQLTGTL
jgi:hypothetical protein